VFASHQVGAALAATSAGAIRDAQGSYNLAWYLAGGLCAAAALMSASVGRRLVTAERTSGKPAPTARHSAGTTEAL
jgi:hypothetical protein